MTGEEQKLYARAEMLEETGDLAAAVEELLDGAQGAGVDPRAVIGLTAALRLCHGHQGASTAYDAGSQKDRRTAPGTARTGSSSRRSPMPRIRSASASAK